MTEREKVKDKRMEGRNLGGKEEGKEGGSVYRLYAPVAWGFHLEQLMWYTLTFNFLFFASILYVHCVINVHNRVLKIRYFDRDTATTN